MNNQSAPVAFVTGGSRGLGRALVKQLFGKGYSVYFSGRDQLAINSLIAELKPMQQNKQDIDGIIIDQSDLHAIEMLDNFAGNLPSIDLLVNNAGLIPKKPAVTAQGFEQAFGVNYLAHVLITQKLWQKLLAAENARVINVSSLAFGNGMIDWLQPRSLAVDGWQAYSASKLALILFTEALAARNDSSITINSVCPGIVDSDLLKEHPLFPPSMLARLANAMQPADVAADYLVWLATAPELHAVSGKFFSRSQAAYQPLKLNLDHATSDRLWQRSMQWLAEHSVSSRSFQVENPWVLQS